MARYTATGIAVTGASGRLGHAVVRSLLAATSRPVAVVRDQSRMQVDGCEIRRADYGEED